jgi:hypothetical protein
MEDQHIVRLLLIQGNRNTLTTQIIYASSGIRIRDPTVRADGNTSYSRPRDQCDQSEKFPKKEV